MLGVNDYFNNDQCSVSSEDTYYSNEAVSNEYEDEYEEECGYYEDGQPGYMEEVVPYLSKTIPEKPKVTVNMKIPEVNPWSKNQGENAPKEKSFMEIMEEEQKLEEQRKKKAKEDEERKARFKRKKNFNFRNIKQDKSHGSLLLRNKELKTNANKSNLLSKK